MTSFTVVPGKKYMGKASNGDTYPGDNYLRGEFLSLWEIFSNLLLWLEQEVKGNVPMVHRQQKM